MAGPSMGDRFQVRLADRWEDYDEPEDQLLKRAYLAGLDEVSHSMRGRKYQVDFRSMRQKNLQSGKLRPIRTPPTWVAEERLGGAASPRCLAVVVPEGGPGSCIYVPNPDREGDFLAVQVPGSARVGHSMLVPLPPSTSPSTSPSTAFTAFAPSAPPPTPSTAAAP
ncbi:E3 ubiquitin-protein ligase TRIP12 (HECT-type E3 ubiquitin transferase TRIP12) (Thyroid receptor-interacting protein 12) (TR-interacting protein 12) (TRIP-12), partial [Durusdinium trenchii]